MLQDYQHIRSACRDFALDNSVLDGQCFLVRRAGQIEEEHIFQGLETGDMIRTGLCGPRMGRRFLEKGLRRDDDYRVTRGPKLSGTGRGINGTGFWRCRESIRSRDGDEVPIADVFAWTDNVSVHAILFRSRLPERVFPQRFLDLLHDKSGSHTTTHAKGGKAFLHIFSFFHLMEQTGEYSRA